jgi:predicted ATPase
LNDAGLDGEVGSKAWTPFLAGLLAQVEAEGNQHSEALSRIAEALTLANEISEHWVDSFLQRIRGEILLKGDPANTAAAEEAFIAAIAIAQHQNARSFELRAALALAKLYRATARDADAYAVLGPALEGFTPTTEFPEIAEAMALIDGLAESDAVKATTSSRVRQVQLQIALGNALIATRGHGALETTAAFAKARELARGIDDAAARASINYGLWVGSYTRGELRPMLELADAFLRDTASSPSSAEAGVAERINGVTRWFQGDFIGARAHYERALAIFNPDRDRELAFRFGQDQFVATEILLALVLWPLGEVDEARRFANAALQHAQEGAQTSTLAYVHTWASGFEILREDIARTTFHVDALQIISRENDLAFFASVGLLFRGWLDGRAGHGGDRIREAAGQLRLLGYGVRTAAVEGVEARFEADSGRRDVALAILDKVIADEALKGQHWLAAEDHRARGEVFARYEPADLARAEDAFLTAIAIAQAQKAHSFELRAALALAKLYRATARATREIG